MNESALEILTLAKVRLAFPGNPARLWHIEAVFSLAQKLEVYGRFNGELELAALYHDAGYAQRWQRFGFHPVDGMALARDHGLPPDIQNAVLYHTGSWRQVRIEKPDLAEAFYKGDCLMMETRMSRATTFCDLRSGPIGQAMSLDARLEEIRIRHAARPSIMRTMREYEERFRQINAEFAPLLTATRHPVRGLRDARL